MTKGCKKFLKDLAKSYCRSETGSTAIEYALIAALIGLGILGGLSAFGDSNTGSWGSTANKVSDVLD